MTKQLGMVLAVLFALFAGASSAHGQTKTKTEVTIDSIDVKENVPGMTYTITVKGTLTLGKDNTWGGVKFQWTDPNGQTVSPTILEYQQPQAGFTTGYTLTHVTATKGTWNATTTMYYGPGTPPSVASLGQKFDVPKAP